MTFATPGQAISNAIYNAAAEYGVDPSWLFAVGNDESGLNPNVGNGAAGEIGPFQVLPSTGSLLGFTTADLNTLQGNANAAAAYLAQLDQRYNGNTNQIFSAYNAGTATSANQSYVQNILAGVEHYANNAGSAVSKVTSTVKGAVQNAVDHVMADGTIFHTNPDGSQTVTEPDGTVTQISPQGKSTLTNNPAPAWAKQLETYVTGEASSIEAAILLGGVALALIAGGFALLAAEHPQQTKQIVIGGAKKAAAALAA